MQNFRLTQKSGLRLVVASLRLGEQKGVFCKGLASVAHADRIVAIKGGVIIEEGDHHKLMADSKRYREWYLVQQSEKLDQDIFLRQINTMAMKSY